MSLGSPAALAIRWLANSTIVIVGIGASLLGLLAGLLTVATVLEGGLVVYPASAGLVIGPAILLRRPWSRRVVIGASWLFMLGPPLLAYYVVGNTYQMHRLVLAEDDAPLVLIATGLVTLVGLLHNAAFTSRASDRWFRTGQDGRPDRATVSATEPKTPTHHVRPRKPNHHSWGLLVGAILVVVQGLAVGLWSYTHVVFEELGRVGGGLAGLAIVDDRAYASIGGDLAVLDLADPDRPMLLGRSFQPWEPEWHVPGSAEVVANGDRVFVGGPYERTLVAYDVTDPRRPTEVSHLTAVALGGLAEHLAVRADLLIAAGVAYEPSQIGPHWRSRLDRRGQIGVLSTRSALTPNVHGRLLLNGEVVALAVSKDYAYVITRDDIHHCDNCGASGGADTTLQVISIKDPHVPVSVGRLSVPSGTIDLVVWDRRGVLVTRDGRLVTLDVSHPRDPVPLATIDLEWPGSAVGMAADGTTLWIRGTAGHLMRVDLSAPEKPSMWSFETLHHIGPMAAIDGRLLFLAGPQQSDASAIYVLGSTGEPPDGPAPIDPPVAWRSVMPHDVHLSNGAAYVLGGDGQVHRIDAGDPTRAVDTGLVNNGRVLSLGSTAEAAYGVLEDGTFIRLATEAQVPSRSLKPPPGGSYSKILAIANDLALVKARVSTVDLVAVADPDGPVRIGSINLGMKVNAATLFGQHAYFAVGPVMRRPGAPRPGHRTAGQIVVVDIADPSQPVHVGAVKGLAPPLDREYTMAAFDGLLFGSGYGLGAYDLQNPSSPEPLGRWTTRFARSPTETPFGVVVAGNQIQVYRTGPLRRGSRSGASPTQRWPGMIAADGELLYSADNQRGLRIFRIRRHLITLLN